MYDFYFIFVNLFLYFPKLPSRNLKFFFVADDDQSEFCCVSALTFTFLLPIIIDNKKHYKILTL